MSFLEYPNYLYEIVTTGGTTELGTWTINNYKQASNVVLTMLFYDTGSFTSERVRISAERSSQADTIISDWLRPATAIADFTSTDHWIGAIRFDYGRQNLQDGDTLQLFLETENYTWNPSGIQIGAILNYVDATTGVPEVLDTKAAYANVFGYE